MLKFVRGDASPNPLGRAAAGTALFLAVMGVAQAASAECAKPPRAPAMPQGATATDEEMKAGHDALQKYVGILEEYQKCLDDQIKSAPTDTKPEVRASWQASADVAIEAAHEIADVYSIQLRAFKSRQ